jgi:hypothetical protein
LQNKIQLDANNNVRVTGELPRGPIEFDLSAL